MTDISEFHGRANPVAPDAMARRGVAPFVPYACVLASGGLGLAAGLAIAAASGVEAAAFEDKLRLLLRFMAALKFGGALLAAAALHWRGRYPLSGRLEGGYIGALATMAFAPGLIWSLGAIGWGALCFHAGLLAFLYLAWTDDGLGTTRRRRF